MGVRGMGLGEGMAMRVIMRTNTHLIFGMCKQAKSC